VAIVIGKRGKNIPAQTIREYTCGVTLFHDWSIRDAGGVDRVVSYNLQKNFDGAVSMGPCIVVGELDHQDIDTETRVNGVVRQSYNTSEMIWVIRRRARISFPRPYLRAGRRYCGRHIGGNRCR
jgi:2-keto-4-pentenoate hydratase/2-oxohepta-3-ene-1,7-dioic acid hydratase in catechol pathway